MPRLFMYNLQQTVGKCRIMPELLLWAATALSITHHHCDCSRLLSAYLKP